jgi:hypothetical protein
VVFFYTLSIKNTIILNLNILIMKKIFLTAAITLSISTIGIAQDEKEVLLFSQHQTIGTARSLAVGGAMGSIGADFAGLSVNPASLGKYSKAEFTFTPSTKLNNTSSAFLDKNTTDDKSNFAFDNLGLVVANRKEQKTGWKATNFAIGFNRVANFNTSYAYNGINNKKNSITNQFIENANAAGGYTQINNASLLTQMAYNTYLIDTVNGVLQSFVPTTNLNQSKIVTETGGINEVNISLAGNNNDQLLIGGSIGIPIVNYTRTTNYQEEDLSGNAANQFESFNYTETLRTSGGGINIKLGAIYMPIPNIRLGVALHSPTYFTLTEQGDNSMAAKLENFIPSIKTNPGDYKSLSEYNVTTPYRAVLSGSYVFGKYGFITADYEFVDYTKARISFTDNTDDVNYANGINNVVKKVANNTNNLRLGAEYRAKIISLRAGYAIIGSDLQTAQFNTSRRDFSLGLGTRFSSFFIDAAWVNSNQNRRDYMYVLNGVTTNNASISSNTKFINVTMGWKF